MTIHHGDCLEVMAAMPASSIDAIATDPPYGLKFMGKAWDAFRVDDPGTNRNRGDRAGQHGELVHEVNGRHGKVGYGGGGRPSTSRCTGCGKRDQFRNDHSCPPGTRWATELIDPFAAPPTSLAFQSWCRVWAAEAYRIAKPGAHLLAFGGTRTYHRLVSGLEDAGWEIRDTLVWAYASGFPKSLDVGKAIDKAAGAERAVLAVGAALRRMIPGADQDKTGSWIKDNGREVPTVTAPATPEAEAWQGWGTALKPAWEPIVLARKPLTGSVARNVLEHGTGALNIDGTRIGPPDGHGGGARASGGFVDGYEAGDGFVASDLGRWPANVVLTDPIFDGDVPGVIGGGEQSGGGTPPRRNVGEDERTAYGEGWYGAETGQAPVDTAGTYSRFFLIPKADRDDREPVIGGQLPTGELRTMGDGAGEWSQHGPGAIRRENVHPTVKPTELMRHLVRLITPPGGTVLDPFLGSGTTAVAAELEGFAWIGIEREAEYVAIAEARLNGTQRGLGLDVPAPTRTRARGSAERPVHAATESLGLDEAAS